LSEISVATRAIIKAMTITRMLLPTNLMTNFMEGVVEKMRVN